MLMISDYILELAKSIDPKVKKNDISLLQGGFSSQAYSVRSDESDFVLLTQRAGGVTSSNYGHAFVVLNILKNRGFKFAPDPIWLKDDHSALAISYFDGQPSNEFIFDENVSPKEMAVKVIDSLLDVAVVTTEEYEKLASKYNINKPELDTPKDNARKYGTEWFEIVKKSCPDKNIIDWLEPRVEKAVSICQSIKENKPVFSHGDPSNPNILIKRDGNFMLIDWDSSRFGTAGPQFNVAYSTSLTDFMKPYRKELIEHAANRLNIPVDKFTSDVIEYSRYTGVFDVNWAAMMMAKVSSGETEGNISEFHETALKRMKEYETSFKA
jgi:aminoglycoside phosphotransferase (APT) family kinase protein